MTFQSVCSAMPGCVALWVPPASGTVITDVQSAPANLTLGARGSISGTPIIPEDTNSIAGTGSAGVAASCVVNGTTNTKLRIDGSTGLTVGIWLTSGTPVNGAGLIGRTNNWRLTQTGSSGVVLAALYLGGVAKTVSARNPWFAGQTGLVYMTYNKVYLDLVINGSLVYRTYYPYTAITATSDAMEVMSVNGTSYPGTGLPAFVFNRAISLGEGRNLLRAGDTGRVIEVHISGKPTLSDVDLVADNHLNYAPNPVVQASAQDKYCGFDGGLMRHNEASVTDGNDTFHPGCHVAAKMTASYAAGGTSLTTGTKAQILAKYGARVVNIANEWTNGMGKRMFATWNSYQDPTSSQWVVSPTVSMQNNLQGIAEFGLAGATMYRFLGHNGPSPWLNVARNIIKYSMSWVDSTGSYIATPPSGSVNNFGQWEGGTLLLMLKGCIDQQEWDGYLDTYLKSVNHEWSGTAAMGAQGATGATDSTFYINGNRVLQVAGGFYIAWMLTGNATYKSQFETAFQFLIDPRVQFGANPRGNGANDDPVNTGGAAHAGLYQYGGVANVSTGAGYSNEYNITSGGTPTSAWVGSDPRIPAASLLSMNPLTDMGYFTECQLGGGGYHVDATHCYWGMDTGYTAYQASLMSRLWVLSTIALGGLGDPRFLMLFNLLRNATWNRMIVGSAANDGTYGSRHQNNNPWGGAMDHWLYFYAGGPMYTDSRFTTIVADLASMWDLAGNGFEPAMRIQGLSGPSGLQGGWMRSAGGITEILMMQPGFPMPNLVKGA